MKCLFLFLCVSELAATIVQPTNSQHSSSGCGATKPSSGKVSFTNQGRSREYWVHVPSGYNVNSPVPVVILFHGWGYSGKEWYSGSGLGARSASLVSEKYGFLLVAPTGLSDSNFPGNCDNGGGYCSWNAAGTTGSPGPEGSTCNTAVQTRDLCYHDTCLDGCRDSCWWTTCNDDTTFVHALLDKIESEFCVDRTRVYAGGESNGGLMTWQMGTDSRAARFAAFVPVIGLPHHGFDFLPAHLPLPIMGVWGTNDRTIPVGDATAAYTESPDGWYYTTASSITRDWAKAHGCNTDVAQTAYPTTAGAGTVTCKTWYNGCVDDVSSAVVVDCRFNGGHSVGAYVPELMWEFFSKHHRQFPPVANEYKPEAAPQETVYSGVGRNVSTLLCALLLPFLFFPFIVN